jgi:hypothetical protein
MTHGEQASYQYDIAVTFAGEDRSFVKAVVSILQANEVVVFYDEDDASLLLGEDLTEFFPRLYEEQARFAAMFISRHYAAKPWTRLERRSVLTRAMKQETPYVLPVRLDATELPGLRSSVGFIDANRFGADGVAEVLLQKLSGSRSKAKGQFDGLVPRDDAALRVVLGEKPPAWEYLATAYELVNRTEELERRYRDHKVRFARSTEYVADSDIDRYVKERLAELKAYMRNLNNMLEQSATDRAWGLPGHSGDVDEIGHFADRFATILANLLDWASRLNGASAESDKGQAVLTTFAKYADQPIEEMHAFPLKFREKCDDLTRALAANEHPNLTFPITWTVPDGISRDHLRAIKQFGF